MELIRYVNSVTACLVTNMDYPVLWRGENYLTLATKPVELAILT
jgi:hypothetical protein